jgi:hypothetical protein
MMLYKRPAKVEGNETLLSVNDQQQFGTKWLGAC